MPGVAGNTAPTDIGIGPIFSFFWMRSKSMGWILNFSTAPPRDFLFLWAADQLDEESLPICGLAVLFGLYLTQRFQWIKDSSGPEVFLTDYPFQSVDKIARTVDLFSKNHREFWATEQFHKLYSPIGSYEDLSQDFPLWIVWFFISQSNIPQRKDLDDCLLQELCQWTAYSSRSFVGFYGPILLSYFPNAHVSPPAGGVFTPAIFTQCLQMYYRFVPISLSGFSFWGSLLWRSLVWWVSAWSFFCLAFTTFAV